MFDHFGTTVSLIWSLYSGDICGEVIKFGFIQSKLQSSQNGLPLCPPKWACTYRSICSSIDGLASWAIL